jgi:hypothetical protein
MYNDEEELMFKKPALLTAFGIGYLLGARAGRERYDAIVAKAQGLWQDPRVQEKAHTARVVAEDKMPGHNGTSTNPTSSTSSTGSTSSHQTTPSAPSPAASADPVTGTPRGWES